MITINELLPIQQETIDQEFVQTVNARGLHEFLESRQEFANWIKSRIADFGFIDNQDFLTILSKTSNGGRPSREHYISLDMAKELAMVERNDKGKQDFSTWIKNRIKKYDFEEDKDFVRFHKKMEADNATLGLSFDSKLINLIREGIENEWIN